MCSRKSKLLLLACALAIAGGCSESPPPQKAAEGEAAAGAPAAQSGSGPARQGAAPAPAAASKPSAPPDPDQDEPVTAVFNCRKDDVRFAMVTRTVPEDVPPTMSVFLPPERGVPPYQRLEAEREGEVYANEDVRLVLSGNVASVLIRDQSYTGCEYDHEASVWEEAKLGGTDFRAVGNEPGWVLEIREEERIDFRYDYGTGSVSLPIEERTTDDASGQTRYLANGNGKRLVVTLTGSTCTDTMSDSTFPTQVEVQLGGRAFSGCGRPLH